jgi:hypothetical protein
VRRFFLLLLCGFPLAAAQSPEAGRVERNGLRATLTVDGPRPLDSAAITLAERYRISVSVEDPAYVYKDDIKDVTDEVSRLPNPTRRVLIPKGGRVEVEFAVRPDASPEDVRALLESLIAQANTRFPFVLPA